ncbi:hypothetical protein ASPZODRAFT_128415, partial [Penicilliopsis zonata CBS 506.65]
TDNRVKTSHESQPRPPGEKAEWGYQKVEGRMNRRGESAELRQTGGEVRNKKKSRREVTKYGGLEEQEERRARDGR